MDSSYPTLKTVILDKIHLKHSDLLTYIAAASFIICLIVFVGKRRTPPIYQSIHDPVIKTIFWAFFCATVLLMLIISISGEEIWKAGTIILNEDTISIQQKKTEIRCALSDIGSFKITKTDKTKYSLLIRNNTGSIKYYFRINSSQLESFSQLNLKWKDHYRDKYSFSNIM